MAKTEYNPFQITLIDALKKLGTSVQAMRKSLVKAKITGQPHEDEWCPLANYLRDEFGIEHVSVGGKGEKTEVDGVSIDTPKFVADFVAAFDNRQFLELIEPDYLDEEEAEKLKKQRKKK